MEGQPEKRHNVRAQQQEVVYDNMSAAAYIENVA